MRLIQVFVPEADRDAVRERLDEMEVSYVFGDADDHRNGSLAYVPVPTGAVDEVLDRLYDAGLDEDTFTVVTEADRATIPNADELSDRYVEGPKGERGASHLEIRERADDLKPDRATYVAFAIASAIVAVGGLLLDSAIVIVGAMVIAPFAGSTLSASVGAVISDREMVVGSAVSQVLGLAVGFVGAVAMSVFLQQTGFVPSTLDITLVRQVSAFATPNLLTLAIAITAGFAGALALATDLPVSIAGVAVAAAIIPAVGTAGIGAVWGQPIVVLGAIVLLLMNIVFINIAAYLTLIALGYRSSVVRNLRSDVTISAKTGAYALIVILFAVVVALTAVGTYQHLVFEQDVNQEVQNVLDDSQYRTLELAGVKTSYDAGSVLGDDATVTVTVSRTSDIEYDQLALDLQSNLSDRTNQPVTVQVRFVDYEEASPIVDQQESDGLLERFAELVSPPLIASPAEPTPHASPHPADLVVERPGAA